MIVTIVAIATVVQKPDWTIATILTIQFLWLNASKQIMDILFSLLLLLIVSLPILGQSDRLLKLLVILLCFIKLKTTQIREFSLSRDYIKEQIFPFEVSSTPDPAIICLYFDSASYENIANFLLSFVQQLSFLYSSLYTSLYLYHTNSHTFVLLE